jgi:hypothetical protein
MTDTTTTPDRPRLLREAEAAARLRLSVHTLRMWRHLSQGPPYARLGSRVFYSEDALAAYVAANTVTPDESCPAAATDRRPA